MFKKIAVTLAALCAATSTFAATETFRFGGNPKFHDSLSITGAEGVTLTVTAKAYRRVTPYQAKVSNSRQGLGVCERPHPSGFRCGDPGGFTSIAVGNYALRDVLTFSFSEDVILKGMTVFSFAATPGGFNIEANGTSTTNRVNWRSGRPNPWSGDLDVGSEFSFSLAYRGSKYGVGIMSLTVETKPAPVSPVPVPAAGFLLLGGLAGLAGLKRCKRA